MGQSQSKPIKDKIRRALTPNLPKSSKLRRLFKCKPKQDVSKYEQAVPIYFQKDSPLFAKLPQELRDMIYRCVLLSSEFIVVRNLNEPRDFVHFCRLGQMEGEGNGLRLLLERLPSDECPQFMGLQLSCCRVYKEAIDIFYKETRFYFGHGKALSQLINFLPPARLNMIRHITLESALFPGFDETRNLPKWSRMIRAAKQLQGLRSVIAYVSPWQVAQTEEMVRLLEEANLPRLEIIYAYVFHWSSG